MKKLILALLILGNIASVYAEETVCDEKNGDCCKSIDQNGRTSGTVDVPEVVVTPAAGSSVDQ